MNIADKLINDVEVSDDELKFLLWNSLIQLSAYCDDVTSVEEESFNNTFRMQNISQLEFSIDSLSRNLNIRYENFAKNFYSRIGIKNFVRNAGMTNNVSKVDLYTNYRSHLQDYDRRKQFDILSETINLTNDTFKY